MFFEKLSEISDKEEFISSYLEFLKNIIGNYSIAFFLKNENKIFISSNCGSLYYYIDNDIFSFASERNFLKKFIENSSLYKKKNINESKLVKCINTTIIFDKDIKN